MNGRELTAADVEYNFHRMLGMGEFTDAGPNPNWPAAALLKLPVEAVTATDKYTFVLKLTEPNLGALWQIFGPKSPQYQIAQPWLIGFNGELALNKWEDYLTFSRLWIDSELKEAMGY